MLCKFAFWPVLRKEIDPEIVGQLWTPVLSRAEIEAQKRHIISVYIDEVQDNISSLSGDISDVLAQARGLGLALVAAHQYRSRLPSNIRAAFDANTASKVVFGMGTGDAREMVQMVPKLKAEDFMMLPHYGIYTNLMRGGKSTG